MHLLRSLAIAAVLAPLTLSAQSTAATSPARVARASAFYPERLARIDSFVQRLVAERKIPGAVVMLVHNGQVAYHKAFGVRDIGTGAPQQRDDIFRIASQTKAVTSLAVMMLWEEGRFALDDPIGKYIPAFKDQTVLTKFNPADSSYEAKPTKRKITIRQLLTHTSGLDYADIGSDEFKAIYAKAGITGIGADGDVLADKINVLGKLPLKHEPGERFTYGLSVDVLGRLVEVVSGMPLDQFFATRIFTPLGMRDTYFALPADRRARLVALHEEKDGTLLPMHEAITATSLGATTGTTTSTTSGGASGPLVGGANGAPRDPGTRSLHPDFPARPMTYFSGGGGLSSTTADYARFLQLFMNGGALGHVRLLGRKTVEMMLTNQIGTLQPAFGLGFALETPDNDFRSVVTSGTFSWGGAFNTTYWADPKEKLIGLIYTNTFQSTVRLGDPFKALVYSALR